METIKKDNTVKILIAIIAVLVVIIGVMGFKLLSKSNETNEKSVVESQETTVKKVFDEFNTNQHLFQSIFSEKISDLQEKGELTKNIEEEISYTYNLGTTNIEVKYIGKFDYDYYKENEDFEMSCSYKLYINGKEIKLDAWYLSWIEAFDDNYLIASGGDEMSAQYYFIDANGNIAKTIEPNVYVKYNEKEYDGYVLYENSKPTELIYYIQACNENVSSSDKALEKHIKYNNGTFEIEMENEISNDISISSNMCDMND